MDGWMSDTGRWWMDVHDVGRREGNEWPRAAVSRVPTTADAFLFRSLPWTMSVDEAGWRPDVEHVTLDDGGWILDWGRWTSPMKILESSLIGATELDEITWDEERWNATSLFQCSGYGGLFWFPIFASVIKPTSVNSVVVKEGERLVSLAF